MISNNISTTALSKKLGIESKELFGIFEKFGAIQKVDKKWQLTDLGFNAGGRVISMENGECYIAWPPDIDIQNITSNHPASNNELQGNEAIAHDRTNEAQDDVATAKLKDVAKINIFSVDSIVISLTNKIASFLPDRQYLVEGEINSINNKYDRWVFAKLIGRDSQINIRIPKDQPVPLGGSKVTLEGVFSVRPAKFGSGIDVEMTGSIIGYNSEAQVEKSIPIQIRTKPHLRLGGYIENHKGSFSRMILAGSNTGISDCNAAFRIQGMNPSWGICELNMMDMSKILEFIDQIKINSEYDSVCIVRGGGEQKSFGVWETPEVINALLNSELTVYSAIGHSTDLLLIDKYADESFTTPTAFGSNAAAALKIYQKTEVLEKEVEEQRKTLTEYSALKERLLGVEKAATAIQEEKQAIQLKYDAAIREINEATTKSSDIEKRFAEEKLKLIEQQNESEVEKAKIVTQRDSLNNRMLELANKENQLQSEVQKLHGIIGGINEKQPKPNRFAKIAMAVIALAELAVIIYLILKK